MKFLPSKLAVSAIAALLLSVAADAQSRRSSRSANLDGETISITAWRTDNKNDPIRPENIFLYENGVEQRIKSLSYDPSPARIVLLVDNSKTLPIELEKLKAAAMEFAYEIFEGDQLFVVAYDEQPEIINEWTDDAAKLEKAVQNFRKKGNPHLFDAVDVTLRDVLQPLLPGTRKTAIVVIGDGLDRGSKTVFKTLLGKLQDNDVTVYSLQLPDRTGGAYRGGRPKAESVISQLTEGTGGVVFPISQAQEAAKFICDELRRNRYLLSYVPVNTSSYDFRRVFVVADSGIAIRTKAAQAPDIQ